MGEYTSALANSAAVNGHKSAYLIWGISDASREVVGTTFKPGQTKGKGNESLEPWLTRSLTPHIRLQFHEWIHEGKSVVMLEIARATQTPIFFQGRRFVRVGSHKKPLDSLPAKERDLWSILSQISFELGIARSNLSGGEV